MPLTQDDMNAVKALIKAERIEEARALLASIEGEKAKAALERFNERYPEEETSIAASNREAATPDNSLVKLRRTFVLVAAIGTLIALAVPALQSYLTRIDRRAVEACYSRYQNAWASGIYTFSQVHDACDQEIPRTMRVYGDEVRYCFDGFNQTDKRFEDCLEEQGVLFAPDFDAIPTLAPLSPIRTTLPTIDIPALTKSP